MQPRVEYRPEIIAGLVDQFSERIAPLGVQVLRLGAVAEAAETIAALAAELVAGPILASSEVDVRIPGFLQSLAEHGVQVAVAVDAASSRDAALGVTTAIHAIAETGSLLMSEATLADRSVGMLSLVLIVVVPTASMLAGLDEAALVLRAEAKRPGGAYSTLMTGPSRTADIEMSLTVGVQGPGRVVVIFIDDVPPYEGETV